MLGVKLFNKVSLIVIYDIGDFIAAPDDKILEYNDMNGKNGKFDCILANPPYQRNLGEKFYIKFLDIADIVCTIQPANWLIGNRKNNELINKLKKLYVNIERISDPGKYFEAGIGNDISINYSNNNLVPKFIMDSIKYNSIDELRKYSGDIYIEEFENNIRCLYNIDNICSHILNYKNGNYSDDNQWCIKIAKIRGHKYGQEGEADDFYTIISKDDKFVLNDTTGLYKDLIKGGKRSEFDFYIPFNNKISLYNFINYIKTDFARTCLYLLKISQNLTSGKITRYIPWFDFSDPIFSKSPKEIDDYLFNKYIPEIDEETGITRDEIRKHIEEILPDYYNIR